MGPRLTKANKPARSRTPKQSLAIRRSFQHANMEFRLLTQDHTRSNTSTAGTRNPIRLIFLIFLITNHRCHLSTCHILHLKGMDTKWGRDHIKTSALVESLPCLSLQVALKIPHTRSRSRRKSIEKNRNDNVVLIDSKNIKQDKFDKNDYISGTQVSREFIFSHFGRFISISPWLRG